MTLEKIVIVTRKTRLEGLVERFNSRAQAKFYLDHSGGDYADYEREDSTYRRAIIFSSKYRTAVTVWRRRRRPRSSIRSLRRNPRGAAWVCR